MSCWKFAYCVACLILVSACLGQETRPNAVLERQGPTQDLPFITFAGHDSAITALAFSSDGDRVVSASRTECCVWKSSSGELIHRYDFGGQVAAIRADLAVLASTQSSRGSVAGGPVETVIIRDLTEGTELTRIDPHGDYDHDFSFRPSVTSLAFSPDGRQLVTAGSLAKVGGPHGYQGGIVNLWDPQTGSRLRQWGPLSTRMEAVAFSADGKYLAAGTQGASGELPEPAEIYIWDSTSGKPLVQFTTQPDLEAGGNPGSVTSLGFSPNGELLAAAISDGTVRIWELPSGQPHRTIQGDLQRSAGKQIDPFTGRFLGPASSMRIAVFATDGRRIATAGAGNVLKIWDVETGAEVWARRFDVERFSAIAFSPDGRHIAAAGQDKMKSCNLVVCSISNESASDK